jgi:hypothetical protein
MLLSASDASRGQASERVPIAATARFAFFSDFETNLNDALIAAGLARKGHKPELFQSGDEVACFAKQPSSVRAAWNRALDYYAEIVSPGDFGGRAQYLIRLQLAGIDEGEFKDAEARQFVEIARSFRSAAAPAYRACRWPAQDERNRRWVEELKPRLAASEQKILLHLEQLYRKRLKGPPIPVDVVQTVSWAGANSVLRGPAGVHLLVSIENQGLSALEVVFHETSHGFMAPGDPVREALENAGSAANFKLPGDLWHVVLFYTTGEVVRRALDEGGTPGFTPMLYGIFGRGSWTAYRKPLEETWRPYVEDERSLSDSAAGLIEAVRKPEPTPPAGDSSKK